MDFLIISTLSYCLLTFSLGLVVFLKRENQIASFAFFALCLSLLVWSLGVLGGARQYFPLIGGEVGLKLAFFGASFLLASLFLLVQAFPQDHILSKRVNIPVIIVLVVLAFLSVYSGLIVEGARYSNGLIVFKKYGPIYPIFSILYTGILLFCMFFSFTKYRKSAGVIRNQAKYFLLGLFLSFAIGTTTNLIFPMLKIDSYSVPQYGPLSLLFFIGFTTFAILKYHLFDIKIILTELLVASIAIPLAAMPFLMPNTALKILSIFIFIFSSGAGYLLIKGVYGEIRTKEKLEQRVQERTMDLQKSNEELERNKKIAEERAAELEKWYKLTIGRELRMAELKEKIKEMEDKK